LGAGNRLLQTPFPVTIFFNKDSASLTAAVVVKKVSRDDYLYTEVKPPRPVKRVGDSVWSPAMDSIVPSLCLTAAY
jgi:hypothetical protein